MIIDEGDYLAHYGIVRKSGRYPWGSGGEQIHSRDFLGMVADLKRKGLSETEICKGLGITTTQLRARKSIANNEKKQEDIAQAESLRSTGMSNSAIGREMGLNESSVRALLAPGAKDKADQLTSTANMLRQQVADKKYLMIGAGVESQLGVSTTMLNNAVHVLKEEGYQVHTPKERQPGTGNETKLKVLVGPETSFGDLSRNRDQIRMPQTFSEDGGRSFLGLHPPIPVNPNRVAIHYSKRNEKDEEIGGGLADGVLYVRPGVPDVSLGNASYAQVRVQVGKGHYLKGMAMYKDDLPDGVDIMFNTNKTDTGNKLAVMKELKKNRDGTVDIDNPFGSNIHSQVGIRKSDPERIVRQLVVRDPDGTEKVTSAMNIVNAEGRWLEWQRTLPAQVLSKQSPSLAKEQLKKFYDDKNKEYEETAALTNPTVRKKLLTTFGDKTDSHAVHLRAAALPRQISHVILPITSMKESEIYAPNYRPGETVVLVRFPHGGKFEIPELTVNNNHPEAKRLLGQARDAVGIHPSVAQRLSGADFDGDAVLVIPNNQGKIKNSPALKGLKDFDPQRVYKLPDDAPRLSADRKQQLMGDITNLITDMSIQNASTSEIAAAVRHSMVVIDAEKHHLNYKLSAEKNGISNLKKKYQGKASAGASTLISRATSKDRTVLDYKERTAPKGGPIDKETGQRKYEPTNKSYVSKKTGEVVFNKRPTRRLALTDDAFSLVSGDGVGTPIERVYAEHANKMKALANKARKEAVNTPRALYSKSARKAYATEVSTLNAKLSLAVRNAPLERQAIVLANAITRQKKAAHPEMDRDEEKKISNQALAEMRNRTGAGKKKIEITEREWQAIQAGAISDSRVSQILDNADLDIVKAHATPRPKRLMSPSNTAKAKTLLSRGYTRAEVAAELGVSLSTLDLATSAGDEGD